MLNNITDTYKLFLDLIKKEGTATVTPEKFNRIINEAQMDWYMRKAPMDDFSQDEIDDIQIMNVITDGVFIWYRTDLMVGVMLYPISSISDNVFEVPVDESVPIINDHGLLQLYPRYFRFRNVQFRMSSSGEWLEARPFLANKKDYIMKSSYRRPTDTKLYYEMLGNRIRVVTGGATAHSMKLSYLRYPLDMNYDTDPNLQVHCEFGPRQTQEIVYLAAQLYLERTKDERAMKQQS